MNVPDAGYLDTEQLRVPGDGDLPRVADEIRVAVPAVESIVVDAARALDGDSAAAQRLRKRLAWTFPGAREVDRDPVAIGTAARDADDVGPLLSGVAWSARGTEEAEAMLGTLARVLEPFDLLAAYRERDRSGVPDLDDELVRSWQIAREFLAIPDDGPPLGPLDEPIVHLPGVFRPVVPVIGNPWERLLKSRPLELRLPAICVWEALARVSQLASAEAPYRIDSLSPSAICATKKVSRLITITGVGFGATGTVAFHTTTAPDAFVEVAAQSWSDTVVTVLMPVNAVSGPIQLRLPLGVVVMCGRSFPVYRLAESLLPFEASVSVYHATVNGQPAGSVLEDRQDVLIEWETSTGPSTRVVVTVTRIEIGTNAILMPATQLSDTVGGSTGSLWFALPQAFAPQLLRVEVWADNGCTIEANNFISRDYTVAPKVAIQVYSLEVTQGYQHHPEGNIQTKKHAPFGSTDLVVQTAGKDTIVRAYVGYDDKGMNGDSLPGVTGVLTVDGKVLLPEGSPTVAAKQSIYRRPISTTLNFRIPAAWCFGTRRIGFIARGVDPVGRPLLSTYSLDWTWTNRLALKVRWVRIDDTRPGIHPPSVTDAAGDELLVRAFDLLPSPATNLGRAVVPSFGSSKDPYDHEIDVDDWIFGAGGLDGQADMWWNLDDVHDDADRDDEIWVGMLGPSDAGGKTNRGSYTVIAASKAEVIAHELGHSRGLAHVLGSCRGADQPDGAVSHSFLPGEFIEDVPVHPHLLATIDAGPDETLGDLMSYSCVRWTGPVTWTVIFNGL